MAKEENNNNYDNLIAAAVDLVISSGNSEGYCTC